MVKIIIESFDWYKLVFLKQKAALSSVKGKYFYFYFFFLYTDETNLKGYKK